ncbi:MAG TPA: 2-oxoacid:acceptor oxidoreductase subunit alpha [Candidatus Edwardsbacteria bacterium]|nr:2-oxoacid:acceptor oxidoreductase subunit alpha [Candidatus Edwardsbacteria bacterium]
MIDLTIIIAGAAGQGMQTISFILSKALTRQGYYVYCYQDLMSRVRGGHNVTAIRISDRAVGSSAEKANILIALDRESIDLHAGGLVADGVIVFDGGRTPYANAALNLFPAPLERLAVEHGQNKQMANTVACGVACSLLSYDVDVLADTLGEIFAAKGDPVVEANIRAARAGFEFAEQEFKGVCPYCTLHEKRAKPERRLLMTGSEAAAYGALVSGLKFLSAYPMSPATAIMEYLAAKQDEVPALVVEQAEDEIAAINMAIGAAAAGVRAMTSTSGGGFALMTEALSLAGMAEVPLVVYIAQRPGPATGFPTRTEQGDLLFALYGGHGEFARAILAPGDAEEAVYAMGRAFNLADRYQTPAIVLGDQDLNDSHWTFDNVDFDKLTIDRGRLLGSWDKADGEYRRYHPSADGISPRLAPGATDEVQYWDSDEHSEQGHITESAALRRQMVAKRLHKLKGMALESLPPVVLDKGDDVALVGFGSSKWAVREAVEALASQGVKASAVHFAQPYPLNPETAALLGEFLRVVVVEQNATGQFAKLLLTEAGVKAHGSILRFDGRPLTAKYIVDSYNSL